MATFSASEARKRFGQVLKLSQDGPVYVEKNGKPAAVILSSDEYARLKGRSPSGVRPEIEALLQRSIERHGEVYKALAKLD